MMNPDGSFSYSRWKDDTIRYSDKEIAMRKVFANGSELQYCSEELRDDFDVVIRAVAPNNAPFKYEKVAYWQFNDYEANYSPSFDEKKAPECNYLKQSCDALKYASARLRNDKEIVMAAVETACGALKHASARLKSNKTVVLKAFKSQERFMTDLKKMMTDDKFLDSLKYPARKTKIVVASVTEIMDSRLFQDRDVAFQVVSMCGTDIAHCSDFWDDFGVVMEAVINDGEALRFISTFEARDNEEIASMALLTCPNIYFQLSNNLRDNVSIIKQAIRVKPTIYSKIAHRHQKNFDIAFTALFKDAEAYEAVAQHFPNHKPLALFAVRKDGRLLRYVKEGLRSDIDITLAALRSKTFVCEFHDLHRLHKKDPYIKKLHHELYALKNRNQYFFKDGKWHSLNGQSMELKTQIIKSKYEVFNMERVSLPPKRIGTKLCTFLLRRYRQLKDAQVAAQVDLWLLRNGFTT
jgi:hypothetical protein